MQQGFLGEFGQRVQGYARWFVGPLDMGMMVDLRRDWNGQTIPVQGFRCDNCGHLALFAV